MNALDRRTLLLAAIFPSLAAGLLNEFWQQPAYRLGVNWFYLTDVSQWIVVPFLVWLFILRPGIIRPADYGLDWSPWRQRPLRAAGIFALCTAVLWFAYGPVKEQAYAVLWQYAGSFGYGDAMPSSYSGRAVVAVYYAATAALVEEVVFRGLPWAYFSLALPKTGRTFLYVTLTSLLFAATHSEMGLPGMISAASYGIAAACLYAWLRNLWPLVLGHFVCDLIAFWPA